jgi:hypothetical protein
MAGLAAGSFAGYVSHRINTAIAAATLAAVNIAALVCMFAFKGLGQSGSFGFILVLVAATGFSAGAAFNAAAEKSDTGALYSFDMIGGACGAILFNLVVLPLLGPAGALALNAVLLVPVMLMRI